MKSNTFFNTLSSELNSKISIEKNSFKIKAYKSVLNQINKIKSNNDNDEINETNESNMTNRIQEINSIDDLKTYNITGIGKSIKTIIEEILKGSIKPKKESKNDKSVKLFMDIMSVGVIKAKKLVDSQIYTIEDLERELIKNPKLLNDKQKIGLKYYKDFKLKIPRNEMKIHNSVIGHEISKLKNITYEIVGSFRRGLDYSGDIDVIITSNNNEDLTRLVNKLKENKYIYDDFAHGEKKYMGCCKVCSIYRRIDILHVSPDKYPFALTYFTGSKDHNIKMRKAALKMGYSLNEFGLKKKNEYIQTNIKNEKDLFDFLNMEYIDPELR